MALPSNPILVTSPCHPIPSSPTSPKSKSIQYDPMHIGLSCSLSDKSISIGSNENGCQYPTSSKSSEVQLDIGLCLIHSRGLCTSLMDLGSSTTIKSYTSSGLALMPLDNTKQANTLPFQTSKTHFSGLRLRLAARRLVKVSARSLACSSLVLLLTTISLMYERIFPRS